jgi:hypothetical protein
MTEDDKALVEQLRDEADTWDEPKHADEIDMRGKLHTAADRIEAQAAEIEKLKRDHAAAVKEANIAKARLKGVEKQWHADRAALKGSK